MLEGLKNDFAIVSINYRLCGETHFLALVQDAKAAVKWIRGNAEKFGFDPERIVAWGGSAGGYLVSMLQITSELKELRNLNLDYPNQPCDIQSAEVWFDPTDFLKVDERFSANGFASLAELTHWGSNSLESLLLGDTLTNIPDRVQSANPETYISGNFPKILLQHGRNDATFPVQQSVEFYEKLKQKSGKIPVILKILENAEHADTAFETWKKVDCVFRFLKKI